MNWYSGKRLTKNKVFEFQICTIWDNAPFLFLLKWTRKCDHAGEYSKTQVNRVTCNTAIERFRKDKDIII